jgi:predicted Zn finger-like uncharacterized protein
MAADGEMHVTCGNCGTVYRLDPVQLGAEGRMVRCTQCRNTWRQTLPEGFVASAAEAPDTAAPAAPAEPAAEPPEWMMDEEKPEDDLAFRPSVKGQYFLEEDMRVVPELPEAEPPPVMPASAEESPMPVLLHKPFGLGAAQFGALTFVLLFSVTLSGLLLARQPVAGHFPAAVALYDALGVSVKAPGEGLMLSQLVAENRVDASGAKVLAVEAKVANISGGSAAYPALKVAVSGPYGAVLKEWRFRPDAGSALAPGAEVPVQLKFRDAPEDGKTVEISVTENEEGL